MIDMPSTAISSDIFGKKLSQHAAVSTIDMKTYIQSILIPKSAFTLKEARVWIKEHDYKLTFYVKKVDITVNYYRFRQLKPSLKRDKIRTISLPNGIKKVVYYIE